MNPAAATAAAVTQLLRLEVALKNFVLFDILDNFEPFRTVLGRFGPFWTGWDLFETNLDHFVLDYDEAQELFLVVIGGTTLLWKKEISGTHWHPLPRCRRRRRQQPE